MSEVAQTSAGGLRRVSFKWLPKLPLLPSLIFLVILFVWPVAQLLSRSFIGADGGLSLEHYERLFGTTLYIQILGRTFQLAGWTTLLCLLFGYPVAYIISKAAPTSRRVILIIVLMPFWTSVLVRTLAWMVILGRRGVINRTAESFGLIDDPFELMFGSGAVLTGMTHALLPLAVLTMLSVMQNIDNNLESAAATLGARGGQTFWRVYFPLSLPGVAAAGLLVFVSALGFFVTPILLGSPQEGVIAQVIIFQMEQALNWGFAGAVAIMLLVMTLITFAIFNKLIGMSTLSGDVPQGTAKRRNTSVRGQRLLNGLGWASAFIGDMLDRVSGRAGRSGSYRPRRKVITAVIAVLIIIFLAVPTFFLVPISFSENQFIEWPPRGFTLQWYNEYASSPIWQQATIRSLVVGILTAILSLFVGLPAAFVLARQQIFGKQAVMGFLILPMIMPHIIVAIGLFYLFSLVGLVGTTLGLVFGHTIFAMPYVIITIMATLRNYDTRLDQASWTLGASPLTTFRRITMPLIMTGVLTSFIFAFVKSFDELTVALFIAGGRSTTLPRQLWSETLFNITPTLAAVSTVMIVLVTAIILVTELLNRRKPS